MTGSTKNLFELIDTDSMTEIRRKTQEKWNSLGFLEGLGGHVKENVAHLFESQASSLSFESMKLPIAKRVYAQMMPSKDVSMSGESSQ